MKTRTKKIIAFFLFILVLVTLFGCEFITSNIVSTTDNKVTSNNSTSAVSTTLNSSKSSLTSSINITTSKIVTTVEPTTVEPTTVKPTTVEPTTVGPTTVKPTAVEPTTVEPTTVKPTTVKPTTVKPTTVKPTTVSTTKPVVTGSVEVSFENDNSSDSGTLLKASDISSLFSTSKLLTSVDDIQKLYPGAGGVKFSSGSGNGVLDLTLSAEISKIIVYAEQYKNDSASLTVNGVTLDVTSNKGYEFSFAKTKKIEIAAEARLYVYRIVFYANGTIAEATDAEKVEVVKNEIIKKLGSLNSSGEYSVETTTDIDFYKHTNYPGLTVTYSVPTNNYVVVNNVDNKLTITRPTEEEGNKSVLVTITINLNGEVKSIKALVTIKAKNSTSISNDYKGTYYSSNGVNVENLFSMSSTNVERILKELMTDTHDHVTSYDEIKSYFKNSDADPNKSGNILSFYSRNSITGNWNGGYDREHVWPQSLGGFGTSGAGADLHHIRPTIQKENSSRGNKVFGYVSNGSELTVNGVLAGIMSSNVFEPTDDVKGDAARIVFYIAVRYGLDLAIVVKDDTFAEILEWNELDPVDELEITRNNYVEGIQGNRNVFIDYPELAELIWG